MRVEGQDQLVGTRRYLLTREGANGPHIRAEFAPGQPIPLEWLDVYGPAYTERFLWNDDPLFAGALGRWDRGDQSLYAHDQALTTLTEAAIELECVHDAMNLVKAADVDVSAAPPLGELWEAHQDDPICALAVRVARTVAELQAEIKALGVPSEVQVVDLPEGDAPGPSKEEWAAYRQEKGTHLHPVADDQ